MVRHFYALSLGIGALLLATHHAFAQSGGACIARDRAMAQLSQGYGESRRAIGLTDNNLVLEVFASEQSGS